MKKNVKKYAYVMLIIFCVIFEYCYIRSSAEDKKYYPKGNAYEGDASSTHEIDSTHNVSIFSYAASSLGSMQIKGDINKETVYDGIKAYGVNNAVTLGYVYSNAYQSGDKTKWNICKDDGKSIAGINLNKAIGMGTLIVQKSSNGNNWTNACEPIRDYFKNNTSLDDDIYVTTDEEIKSGTYYRIIVAYSMQKCTSEAASWFEKDVYEVKRCTEIYQFFICSDKDYITLKDIDTGGIVGNGSKVDKGFDINWNGSSSSVLIEKNGDTEETASPGLSICDQGNYVLKVVTTLGETYEHKIEVTNGINMSLIQPYVYESDDKKGYPEEKRINVTTYGATSYTGLRLGTKYGYDVTYKNDNGNKQYGIAGDTVSIYLQLKYAPDELSSSDWKINDDSWGSKENENVNGIHVETVRKGALIIQKSKNGFYWENIDAGRYANGLYTTDFASYYGNRAQESILIYTPDGDDVLNGVYIRIYYAYEVSQNSSKTCKDYLEKYEFYLCSNELDAVAFHNLSIDGQIEKNFGDDKEQSVEVYKKAETMLSGATTMTGFRVDTSLNPTVSYSVTRNGKSIPVAADGKYVDNGKYIISLSSVVGDRKDVTLYVDRNSEKEALERYFKCPEGQEGDIFLFDGKRILRDYEYPVYEAGISYHIEAVDNEHVPVSGKIVNVSTGETIKNIEASSMVKNGILSEPGEYEAVFTTKSSEGELLSGDYYTFTFRFRLDEVGSAPGPRVNQEKLEEYAHSTMSDSYPIYYGLKYDSAAKGTITIIFSDYQSARDYAYEYEKGLVEDQGNGTFRYIGSSLPAQKEIYTSLWDLTEEINHYADESVVKSYFDMSDPFTYSTLKDETISNNQNPRKLELSNSIILFGDNQKEHLMDLNCLPCVNSKPYRYVMPGANGTVMEGKSGFQFVHDKYGCDSDSVTVIDAEGKEYSIQYNRNIDVQLAEMDCPTGIITIVEKTKYGDENRYEAVFFNGNDVSASMNISYYMNGIEEEISVDQETADVIDIEADAFYINSFVDELDPYSLIIIDNPSGVREFFAADQLMKDVWVDAGIYRITVINRIGNKYSFSVKVNDSDYARIAFSGMGTDELMNIMTQYGEKNIKLPDLERKGYTFDGYVDDKGNKYTGTIEEIHFKGTLELSPVWVPDKCQVTLVDYKGDTISQYEVDYDSYFELTVPEVEEGVEFVAWTIDGEDVSDSIQITKEEVVLIAKVKDKSMESIVGERMENELSDDVTNKKGNGALIVLVLVATGTAIGIKMKNDKKKESQGNRN